VIKVCSGAVSKAVARAVIAVAASHNAWSPILAGGLEGLRGGDSGKGATRG